MKIITEAIGLVAGFLTTVSFFPQVLKTIRTRSSGDLSFGMLGLFSFGVSLWLIYGIAMDSRPIILSNALTLILALSLVGMKIWFERLSSKDSKD